MPLARSTGSDTTIIIKDEILFKFGSQAKEVVVHR